MAVPKVGQQPNSEGTGNCVLTIREAGFLDLEATTKFSQFVDAMREMGTLVTNANRTVPTLRRSAARIATGSRTLAIATRNLLLGGNLQCLRLPLRKAVSYAGECLFLDRVLHAKGDLPQKHVWDLLGVSGNVPVTICPAATTEWFGEVASNGADMVELCALARILNPKVIFEIGTYRGSSAIQLAVNAPEADVYTLDLAPNQFPVLATTDADRSIVAGHCQGQKDCQGLKIYRLYGDSAVFDFSPYHKRVDLFFIDGAHSYEYVRNDTLKALDCVKKGSVIAWHDYGRCGVNGVSRWLHEFRHGRQIYRVVGGALAYMVC